MQDTVFHSDEYLMKGIKAGNMISFDELYRKYSKRLYKFSFSVLKSSEDAENIVQDVFMNLWINRDKIEKDSSVRYYIFSIAYHSSVSIIRGKLRESKFLEQLNQIQDLLQPPADLQMEYRELDEKLNEIINSLPKRQKEVYLLHRKQGLKYAEIAAALNISVNTIENHMSGALKQIRKKLGDYSLPVILFYYLFI
jgi:RNA polymerase sigma-70 factor (ECF subfamily)